MMNIFTSLNRKTTQSIVLGFLILSMLAGILSACNMNLVLPTPTSEISAVLTPSQVPPSSQELTLVSPTEVATETAPSDFIKINMDNIIYSPVGSVKENFEKGEYDAGVETIKKWVNVWDKMGVFEGLEIENNSINPVPLDGRARIVCVRTNEKTKLLCPPLDLINGGLKAVPEEGKWDESDKPLSIIFLGTEELVTKGSGIDMAYQFIDKYQKSPIKYVDPKTSQIVEGEYLAPSEEIVLPDIVPEKMNSIGDYDLGMKYIDSQGAYRMFIEGFMSNEEANGDYWRDLLNGNVNYDAFMDYLRKSIGGPENKNYWWPMTSPNGVEFKPYGGAPNGVNEISYTNKKAYGEGVYLNGIYYCFFSFFQYKNDLIFKQFVDQTMKINYNNSLFPVVNYNPDKGTSFNKPDELSGLLITNNNFVYMTGSMNKAVGEYKERYIGTVDGNVKEIDLNKVSANILIYVDGMNDWKDNISTYNNTGYCNSGTEGCRNGIFYVGVTPIVKFK